MERKEFWVPLAVVGLTALFAMISLLVRATRGRSHWLIRRKLAVGATLLSLTWAASGCSDDGGGSSTCYVPLPTNLISLDGDQWEDGAFVVNLDEDSVLTGAIDGPTDDQFSWLLRDAEAEIARGPVVPTDGAFDESTESIQIDLGADVPVGDYFLLIYQVAPEDITDQTAHLLEEAVQVVDPTP